MIRLTGIEKTFTSGTLVTQVLKGVDLKVNKGEYVALMGSSGTGKSTLMNILGCLDRATAGTYEMDGVDVGKMTDGQLSRLRNAKVGFVFQQFHLLPRATAVANVMMPLVYCADYPKEARKRAEGLLAMVGLRERMHYLPGQLSGGQQQRVAIARSLVNDPRIILADEPTGNLDHQSTNDIMDLFDRLHGSGHTIITVTHDPATAARAQRVVVMDDGIIASDRRGGTA